MGIPRGTTPAFIITTSHPDVDWSVANHVYVSFRQNNNITLTKHEDEIDIDKTSLAVYFTQEESLLFKAGSTVYVQVNWTYGNGNRGATRISKIVWSENLIGGVLE